MAATSHALLSASSSQRWLNCTPSAVLESKEPEETSAFADEGTRAHALAEKKLRSFITHGRRSHFQCDDQEMQECTDSYRDYVIEVYNGEKAKTEDAILMVEQKLDFSQWVPDGFGTGDAVVIGDDTLHVIDLKYGKGVKVDAVGNTQARLYAAGAMAKFGILYGFSKIVVHIYQPRINNISTCEYTLDDLEKWLEEIVKPRAGLAFKGDGDMKPGAWCRFCKVRGKCKARTEKTVEDLGKADYPADPHIMTDSDIEYALSIIDDVKSWIKDVGDFALAQALSGKKYNGYKLVEGRSRRVVSDEDGLVQTLEENGYKREDLYAAPKIKTITALEKLVGRKKFGELSGDCVSKEKGKPTLVPESDKRPEYNTAENDFSDELK